MTDKYLCIWNKGDFKHNLIEYVDQNIHRLPLLYYIRI